MLREHQGQTRTNTAAAHNNNVAHIYRDASRAPLLHLNRSETERPPPAVNRRMLLGLNHGSATRACLPTQKRMVRTAIANFSCPYCLGQALASVYVSTRKTATPVRIGAQRKQPFPLSPLLLDSLEDQRAQLKAHALQRSKTCPEEIKKPTRRPALNIK